MECSVSVVAQGELELNVMGLDGCCVPSTARLCPLGGKGELRSLGRCLPPELNAAS